jgi:HAD superfamily hydrolase (TIGR01509 family)
MLTVLVVSGGGFQGLGILSALRAVDGVRAVVADLYPDSPGRYLADAFHPVPPVAEAEAFLAALGRIAASEGAGLVIPATAIELELLAGAASAFRDRGVAVAVSPSSILRLSADKRLLYAEMARLGFPVLPLVDPRAPDAHFPVIGKPAAGWGSRGVVIARSAGDVAREWSARLAEEYVWQRWLPSCRELSVDFAIDFGGVSSEPGVRLRVRTSGGYAVVTDTAESPEVTAWAKRFAEIAGGMGGRGAFNLQFLEHDGEVFLSDVNPRFGTSAGHWRGTDRDPILHLCRSVDPAIAAPRRTAPRRTVRVLGDLPVDPPPAAVAAVVFDLDDTLLPHKQWIMAKLEALWAAEAAALPARAEFLAAAARVVEEGPRGALFDAMAVRFGWPDERRGRLIDAYRAIRPAALAPYPDVIPALAALRAKGYRLGLLTDNPPASQRQKLDVLGLAGSFDAVVFSREAGGDKPDRAAFTAMSTTLGLPPAAIAMVGDNPYRDGLGALAAGYAAAYVVARPGAFFNFDPSLAGALPLGERLRFVPGLTALLATLPSRRATG